VHNHVYYLLVSAKDDFHHLVQSQWRVFSKLRDAAVGAVSSPQTQVFNSENGDHQKRLSGDRYQQLSVAVQLPAQCRASS
jgi:hypothetical protein